MWDGGRKRAERRRRMEGGWRREPEGETYSTRNLPGELGRKN
jgi:hypothetical protein